mmetsp:Transcript_16784/g.47938  ORF Transcript_16784/g.47938 Transcript_16784/m.47938 type:complete len:201 (+) Transcript_16784:489-1091(+)
MASDGPYCLAPIVNTATLFGPQAICAEMELKVHAIVHLAGLKRLWMDLRALAPIVVASECAHLARSCLGLIVRDVLPMVESLPRCAGTEDATNVVNVACQFAYSAGIVMRVLSRVSAIHHPVRQTRPTSQIAQDAYALTREDHSSSPTHWRSSRHRRPPLLAFPCPQIVLSSSLAGSPSPSHPTCCERWCCGACSVHRRS